MIFFRKYFYYFLLLLQISFAYAQNAPDGRTVSENLRLVRERISREERDLNQLQSSYLVAQKNINNLAEELRENAERKKDLQDELNNLAPKLEIAAKQFVDAENEVKERRSGYLKRVKALYKTRRQTAAVDYLFSARSTTDLLKRARYLSHVAEFDRNYLQGLSKLASKLEGESRVYETLRAQKTNRLNDIAVLEKELTEKRDRQQMLLKEQEEKVKLKENSINKLRISAEGLEKMIASITGGEQYQPPAETASIQTSVVKPVPDVITDSFQGKGLAALKGKLQFPVSGSIVRNFGKQKHEEFSDVLFVKGLEVKSSVGARVKAVAAGKIVLSQVLPGYGNVIIIDHGARYYTLYGRLASSLKSIGNLVSTGEDLAILGETDYKGRNFYFELRVKGKATSPLEYFKNPPRA